MNEQILIIDDEIAIVEFLEINLRKAGFLVEKAFTGKEAIEKLKQKTVDLILLDLMLPDIDGFDLCRLIRQGTAAPIIMLTAKGEDTDKIVGLETGADDYMVKPFNPREVVARINAIFRRLPKVENEALQILIGNITIDMVKRKVWVEDKFIDLSPKEYEILLVLAQHPGELVTREELLKEVWNNVEYVDFRNVDVYIKHLRNKLKFPDVIRTVWGQGYQLIPKNK